eukprot:COSAG02_NODE_13405_length_1398_cov_1.795227_2_plen_21_part_01
MLPSVINQGTDASENGAAHHD